MEEGMEFQGAVKILGNIPCLTCGHGDQCDTAGLKMIFGPQATVDSVGLNRFEEQPQTVEKTRKLGAKIRDFLTARGQA